MIDARYSDYNDYRSSYSIFRYRQNNLKNSLKRRERALKKTQQHKRRLPVGTCANFVGWAYGGQLTSRWNQLFLVKHLIQLLYLPESVKTPDNIANSPRTRLICDKDEVLKYPRLINTGELVREKQLEQKSQNAKISQHAFKVLERLIKSNIIKEDYSVNYPFFRFKTYF